MTYLIFEGKESLKKPKLKKDKDFFDNAVDKLGFKNEIDFVAFCVAIALYKNNNGSLININDDMSLKEVAKMYSFKKSKLYDYIIIENLKINENRLEEFEKYFVAGFNIVRDWFKSQGPELTSEIERFCSIWDHLYKKS